MPRKKIQNMADVEREFRFLILKLDKYKEDINAQKGKLKIKRYKGKGTVNHKEVTLKIGKLENDIKETDLCLSALRLAYRATNLVDKGCDEEEWDSIKHIVGTTYPTGSGHRNIEGRRK